VNRLYTTLKEVDGRLTIDGHELYCGNPIDVLISGTWLKGRVEYSHNDVGHYIGWYFATNDGWCPLAQGMRVRRV
jgi:hypothetical protein